MSSGTVFGTLGDLPGTLKTYVFLKEFNDFHYCGNPGFSLVSVAHPRRPGRPPGTDSTPQPHSAPRAVCTFYIVLFTILFITLRFPKSTATPDHGVGGFERPAATSADPWGVFPRVEKHFASFPRLEILHNYFFGRKRHSKSDPKAPSELPKRLQTASGRSPGAS